MSARKMPTDTQIEEQLLRIVRQAGSIPTQELIDTLKRDQKIDEHSIKSVLWKLLNDSRIVFEGNKLGKLSLAH